MIAYHMYTKMYCHIRKYLNRLIFHKSIFIEQKVLKGLSIYVDRKEHFIFVFAYMLEFLTLLTVS